MLFSIFGHGGLNGPAAWQRTRHQDPYHHDRLRFEFSGAEWARIDFNWAAHGTTAVFNHCESVYFAGMFRAMQHIDIPAYPWKAVTADGMGEVDYRYGSPWPGK